MNKVILLGRLVRDPEVRYTSTGKVVCRFTLAVPKDYTNADGIKEADFIPIVIWGKQAETAGNNLKKGQRTLVNGKLQTRFFEDKNQKRQYVTEVLASHFEFIEKKITDEVQKSDSFGKPFTDDSMPSTDKADFEKTFGEEQSLYVPF